LDNIVNDNLNDIPVEFNINNTKPVTEDITENTTMIKNHRSVDSTQQMYLLLMCIYFLNIS
jgi:hypothetical protein